MPKQAIAPLSKIPPQTMRSLETLGSHLAVAQVWPKESLATRAKRIGVHNKGALEMNVQDAINLGKARVKVARKNRASVEL